MFGANPPPILHRHWHYLQIDRNEIPLDPRRVCPRWFLSLWYVWCKPCTYVEPTLTPSPNRPKWHSTRPTSPRSSVGCIQSDFWAYGTFGANRAPISHQDYHSPKTNRNELVLEAHYLGVPSGASKMIFDPQTVHLSCTNISTISKRTKTRFDMTHVA
jgi:hypothetical protein